MIAVKSPPALVEVDGLTSVPPEEEPDLIPEGADRRTLISLYRLSRCKPPEHQQKANREWVREQLLRLTAAKQDELENDTSVMTTVYHPSGQPNQPEPQAQGAHCPPAHCLEFPPGHYPATYYPDPRYEMSAYPMGKPPLPSSAGHKVSSLQRPMPPPNTMLDPNTLRWRSWVGPGTPPPIPPPPPSLPEQEDAMSVTSDTLYRLTQHEFKRLTDQVRDYNNAHHTKYRGSGFREEDSVLDAARFHTRYHTYSGKTVAGVLCQKVYMFEPPLSLKGVSQGAHSAWQLSPRQETQVGNTDKRFYCNDSGRNVPLVHRSQLASSIKSSLTAFQDRKWLPYQPAFDLPEPPVRPRSRPGSCKSDTKKTRHQQENVPPVTPLRLRPKPVPVEITGSKSEKQSTAPNSRQFDFLHPEILYALNHGVQPESVYGERPASVLQSHEEVEEPETQDVTSPNDENGPIASVSKAEDLDKEAEVENKISDVNSAHGSDTEKDSDDSDDENIPEPDVNNVNMTKIPKFQLRPEKIDDLHVPQPKGDRRRYDFDVDNVEIPPYDFPYPLPDALADFDFKLVTKSDKHWRYLSRYKPEDAQEDAFISRLVEFEKLQKKTEDWENQRRMRIQSGKHRARSGVNSTIRVQNLKLVRESKKCTIDCVQPSCVGDCPSKSDAGVIDYCLVCGGGSCGDTCMGNMYEGHSRIPRENEDKRTASSERHRVTFKPPSCSYLAHTNASIARLRTPPNVKGQPNQNKSRDLRSKSALGVHTPLEADVSRLELTEDIEDASQSRHHRGRAGLVPGKSIFSQRRDSLTDSSRDAKLRALGKKRARSAKKKRPKTAV